MSSLEISPIEDILGDALQGKLFILVDDENRENEGDLVILAEKVNVEATTFMIRHGSGIVCLVLTSSRVSDLGLDLMSRRNVGNYHTAFTTSIDARCGITTGVSAQDRTHTILTAIDKSSTGDDITTPGHVFPLIANQGGVLKRRGHTEASIEIARIVGLDQSAVICEVMNQEDGSMMRLPNLLEFAKEHKIKLTTIDKLVKFMENS
ncbi:3,4-dihydroxy-2-butanone-4-phosphate synthase [Candidatus Mesenet endosymbiont of Agriotes lineatus]|uniref:3,4-dihydroxy-2-butanone-4-phosphate synthase n=1 Tax=Candidatus Mesenet endosymbiont of Agriotes lineatus TaxID=3077948 RepID=UPI0030D2A4B8